MLSSIQNAWEKQGLKIMIDKKAYVKYHEKFQKIVGKENIIKLKQINNILPAPDNDAFFKVT